MDRHIGLFVQQQSPFSQCPDRVLAVRPLTCGMARADLAVVPGRPPGRLPANNRTIESDGHLFLGQHQQVHNVTGAFVHQVTNSAGA